jgi:hypothetical protein
MRYWRRSKMEKWKKIGVVGVDSGTLMITDPCYVEGDEWTDKDYDKYVCGMKGNSTQVPHELGHMGKAVLTTTGFGDGLYPVYQIERNYGKLLGKRVYAMMVVFDDSEFEKVKKNGKKIQKSKK